MKQDYVTVLNKYYKRILVIVLLAIIIFVVAEYAYLLVTISDIRNIINDSNIHVDDKIASILVLTRNHNPAIVHYALKQLKEFDLDDIEANVGKIVESLPKATSKAKTELIIIIGECHPNNDLALILVNYLRDKDSRVRSASARTIGMICTDPLIVEDLIELIDDNNVYVRRAAIWAVGQYDTIKDVYMDTIKEKTKDSDYYVRGVAVHIYSKHIKDKIAGEEYLLLYTQDPHEYVRGYAFKGLVNILANSENVCNRYLEGLDDSIWEVRFYSAKGLRECYCHVDGIMEYMKEYANRENNTSVRKVAIETVLMLEDDEERQIQYLNSLLNDSNEEIREYARTIMNYVKLYGIE